MNTDELMRKVLYPCVRVRAGDAGGSGTAIYSQQDADGRFENFILTCHHVVDNAITIKEKWDAFLGRPRKIEERDLVKVEFFQYEQGSRAIGTYGMDAEIVMHDSDHDLALLRLKQTSRPMEGVVSLYPYNLTHEIRALDECYIVGCALLHPPILTHGRVTSMSDTIEGKSYWMSDAQIIFGNSGGAVFHGSRLEFIGVPSRVAVVGWGSAVTHMGYFSDIERIYKVLEKWCYQYLYDNTYTPARCAEMREHLRREDLELQRRGFLEVTT